MRRGGRAVRARHPPCGLPDSIVTVGSNEGLTCLLGVRLDLGDGSAVAICHVRGKSWRRRSAQQNVSAWSMSGPIEIFSPSTSGSSAQIGSMSAASVCDLAVPLSAYKVPPGSANVAIMSG